jgi:TMEM175 potassium channel family protein
MGKDRLAAFSDGVIAIIITIMVLELKISHGADLAALKTVAPNFLSYVMSFVYLGIYWNNHHHLLHTVGRVDGLILWANSHLLFWLSLVPAATGWLGENLAAPLPTAVYGAVLLMPAIAYYCCRRRSCANKVRTLCSPGRSAATSRANYRRCSMPPESRSPLSCRGPRSRSMCWSR